jgi:transcriptional regulator with XRE-family HTH domain
VDLVRAARVLREIRRHKGWTLRQAATEAGMSPAQAWRIEAGLIDSAAALTRYARGLGATVDVYVRYQGADLDRLLNRRHGLMHEQVGRMFESLPAWVAVPEVTYSVYGERGVVDWVAWHGETGTILIVELKTALVDVNDLLGAMNRRTRLSTQIAAPYGWVPRQVSTWLAFEDGRTNRRHVAEHAAVLRAAFPDDGRTLRSWLSAPARPLRCLSFLPPSREAKHRRGSMSSRPPLAMPSPSVDERMAGLFRSRSAKLVRG